MIKRIAKILALTSICFAFGAGAFFLGTKSGHKHGFVEGFYKGTMYGYSECAKKVKPFLDAKVTICKKT